MRALLLTLSLSLIAPAAMAWNDTPRGCSAQRQELQYQLREARQHRDWGRARGLERALQRLHERCDRNYSGRWDNDRRSDYREERRERAEEYREKLAELRKEVRERERDLREAERNGSRKKIEKRHRKLMQARQELRDFQYRYRR